MMIGKPVVASDLPGVRVSIQITGMGELVPKKNAVRLAEALDRVLKQTYRDDILQTVKNEFSVTKVLATWKTMLSL